jgi:hypothetical protein
LPSNEKYWNLDYKFFLQVLVHGPEEFPDISDRAFVLGPGTET